MRSKSDLAKSAGTPETDGRTEDIHSEDIESEDGVSRRHALISIGKYSAYVAPAMTVLLRGNTALAHNPHNGDDSDSDSANSPA